MTMAMKSNKEMMQRAETGSQEERVAKDGQEEFVAQLREVQKTGEMIARSAVYQAFARYLDAPGHEDEKKKYQDMKGKQNVRAEKEKMRKQWCELKLQQNTEVVARKKEKWQQIDEECGTYEPIMRILEKEGGKDDREAIIATMRYVDKAMKMGGDWVCWNPMTERVDILYLKNTVAT